MKKRKKKVIRLKPLAKIILTLLFILIALYLFLEPFKPHTKPKTTQPKEIIAQKEKVVYEPKNDVLEQSKETQETYQEPIQDTYTTRMTSYWANDGYGTGECTGSGLCSWNFQVNDKGWYTYQGKLVVATATVYLANQGWFVSDGVHLYKYWEELVLTINGD